MSENLTQQLPDDLLRQILASTNSLGERMSGLEQRMTALEDRMTALEEKVDRRLQETRPVWEAVLARLDNLELDMRAGFRRVERVMGEAAKNLLEVQSYQNDLERRMDRLEPESKR